MSVYIDTITFLWAVVLLFMYSNWYAGGEASWISKLGLVAAATYLLAQSGWTVAYFLGDTWGRDWSNYLWFAFNSFVFALLTYLWYRKNDGKS
jgi:hypothetical protein